MSQDLKQATTTTVPIGPFVTSDGTAIESLVLSAGDILLSFNGGALAKKTDATSAAHSSVGFYLCQVGPVDTSALGRIDFAINKTGALPVWRHLKVVTSNKWDTDYGADYYDVNLVADQSGATIGVVNSLTSIGSVNTVSYVSAVGIASVVHALTTVGTVGVVQSLTYVSAVGIASVTHALTYVAAIGIASVVHALSTVGTVGVVQSLSHVTAIGIASVVHALSTVGTAGVVQSLSYVSAVGIASVVHALSTVGTAAVVQSLTYIASVGTVNDLAVTAQGKVHVQALSATVAIGPAKNVELPDFPFFMVDDSDHITPATSLSVVGLIKKDATAFASLTNAVAETASYGHYVVTITQAEMNADKISLVFNAAGADQVGIIFITT